MAAVGEWGKRLLAEVESDEVGLDELLHDLRTQQEAASTTCHFGLPPLDALIQCMLDHTRNGHPPTSAPTAAPVVELMSQHAGSGKTHLLYHLTALAVLPISLGGRHAAVVYFDLDNQFSISRLAQQIRRLALAQQQHPLFLFPEPGAQKSKTRLPAPINDIIAECLRHVLIFRPQTLARTVHTLAHLPQFLFDPSAHHSFDRAIAFLALDSASAFYWQSRAEADEFAATMGTSTSSSSDDPAVGYTHLAAALKSASKSLASPVIYTVRDHHHPPPSAVSNPATAHRHQHMTLLPCPGGGGWDPFSFRPSLLPPFNAQNFATLRLVIRRASVRKLPSDIYVEDAIREMELRNKVVALGKFECFVNEWGLGEKVMERLNTTGAMFELFITRDGVKVGDGPE